MLLLGRQLGWSPPSSSNISRRWSPFMAKSIRNLLGLHLHGGILFSSCYGVHVCVPPPDALAFSPCATFVPAPIPPPSDVRALPPRNTFTDAHPIAVGCVRSHHQHGPRAVVAPAADHLRPRLEHRVDVPHVRAHWGLLREMVWVEGKWWRRGQWDWLYSGLGGPGPKSTPDWGGSGETKCIIRLELTLVIESKWLIIYKLDIEKERDICHPN